MLPLLVWLSFPAGALVLSYAFAYAATHDSGQNHFTLFWFGVFLFTVPSFLRLCQPHAARAERLAIVAAIGLIDYLPKYLREPTFPLFHDEYAHSRQADVIASAGHPFVPNPIVPIAEFFPGLHEVTVWLHDLTGVGQFALNTIGLAVLHVVALLGVFVIAETVSGSARIGGLAAFLYSLNPSFMWFNSQYAYESLAIVFFIWVIAAFLLLDASGRPHVRLGWFVTGLTLAAACVVTHHLSSYFMLATLVLAQAVIAVRARGRPRYRRTVRITGAFTLAVAAVTGAWLLFIASGTPGYLAPHVTGAIHEIGRLILREEHARVLFQKSTAPGYEKVCAYLSPVLVGLGLVGGLQLLRKRRPRGPGAPVMAVLGLAFFASLPVMFTNLGVEGAVRTWAFSYLGLSVVLAPVIPWLLSRGSRASSGAAWRARVGALTLAMAIVLVGNVTMHMNVEYRFPGPFVYGSDTRSLTPELLGTARWFRTRYGIDQNVVTDRYSGLALASFAQAWWARPSPGFPAWDLFLKEGPPSRTLLRALHDADFRYLIVDENMARFVPRVGAYFLPHGGEPGADPVRHPVRAAAVQKFEHLPWTIKVYASDNLAIYRLDFAAVDLDDREKP
jgi:hypothetical protein